MRPPSRYCLVLTALGLFGVDARAINSNGVVFAAHAGVLRSEDDGASWQAVNTGLPDAAVMALAINGDRVVFTGTYSGGVFRSEDNGASWQAVNAGLTNTFVNALAINGDGVVFAGTSDGVFRSSSTAVATEETDDLPTDFALEANYPNPFNPSTLIRYALSEQAPTHLTVYDALGRRVAVLVSEVQPAGRHEVAFEANALPSGVYFYLLEAGNFREVRQMLLLR